MNACAKQRRSATISNVISQETHCELPDSVELLIVLAGVVTSGSSCTISPLTNTGFSCSSRGPTKPAEWSCSPSADMANFGSKPELCCCLLLSVSEEMDVDICCLHQKEANSHAAIEIRRPATWQAGLGPLPAPPSTYISEYSELQLKDSTEGNVTLFVLSPASSFSSACVWVTRSMLLKTYYRQKNPQKNSSLTYLL